MAQEINWPRNFTRELGPLRRTTQDLEKLDPITPGGAKKRKSKKRPPHPSKGKKFPPEPLRRHEIERLIGALANPKNYLGVASMTPKKAERAAAKHAAMYTLMWRLGMRIGETCSVRVCDLDLEGRTLRVMKPKGHTRHNRPAPPRMLGIDDISLRALLRWLPQRDSSLDDGAPIFPSARGTAASPDVIRRRLKIAAHQAGLRYRRVAPHTLRHTFAYEKIMEGRTLPWIRAALGHGDLLTTHIYCDHLAPTEILEDMKEML